jgi:hypothetical protein
MATGRIRRSARRGLAVAVLGWLAVAAMAVLGAPTASAAPQETVEIMNFTPPVKSVDKGGQITFVNEIPTQNKGGISLPLLGSFSATIYTDVSVTFFGQARPLQFGQSTAWTFNDPATAGSITYTYRIVPQAGLAAAVANQVVSTVAASLPPVPAPVPYVVETLVPLPTLPGANLPQLPQVKVQVPTLPGTSTPTPPQLGGVTGPSAAAGPARTPIAGIGGNPYTYETGGVGPQLAPSRVAAGSAFDPSRLAVAGGSSNGSGTGSSGSSGAGGLAGGYDGASVPVFGQLAGLDGSGPADKTATRNASSSTPAQTLPAAALAAVIALAAVTAGLVRTHQASRARK